VVTDWTYSGGKNGAGVFQTIINRIPVHEVYVEPFAGSAAIYRRKSPAASSILMERDPEQAKKLAMLASASTIVKNVDAVHQLETLLPTMGPGWFIYLDPPYVHATRSDLSLYRFEWTDAQHAHLVESLLPAISDRGARWMLSGYDCRLYDDARRRFGWWRHQFQAMTRHGLATETLWMNYDPAAAAIAESTYAGRDFRERERIKRKASRWASKFAKLQRCEQLAIIAKIGGAAGPSTMTVRDLERGSGGQSIGDFSPCDVSNVPTGRPMPAPSP
jgi:DNA adenine methylase